MKKSEIRNSKDFPLYRKFAEVDAPKVAQAMVNKYNVNKRAFEAKYTTRRKRGSIDISRLAYYKTSDEIFGSRQIKPEGVSHGLIIAIDWSASMRGQIEQMAIQYLTTSLFAKRAGIPFRVCVFTSGYRIHNPEYSNSTISRMDISFIANDTMTEVQLREVFYHLVSYKIVTSHGYSNPFSADYTDYLDGILEMRGTPLLEASVDIYIHATNMKRSLSLQSMNVLFITDGAPNSHIYDLDSRHSSGSATSIVCPFTVRRYDIPVTEKNEYSNPYQLLESINQMYRDAGIRIMNIYLTKTNRRQNNYREIASIFTRTSNIDISAAHTTANEIVGELTARSPVVYRDNLNGYNKMIFSLASAYPEIIASGDNKDEEYTDRAIARDFRNALAANKSLTGICNMIVQEMCSDLK